MPIFEYCCDDCGTKFEKLVRRAAEIDSIECPACRQNHLTTQYSTFSARAASAKAAAADCGAGACGTGFCGSGACGTGVCGNN